jgi:hypothetical protein
VKRYGCYETGGGGMVEEEGGEFVQYDEAKQIQSDLEQMTAFSKCNVTGDFDRKFAVWLALQEFGT